MNEPVAVIIGAAVAAISGLSVALLTSWRQSRLEYEKWLRAKADDNKRWLKLREDDRQKDIRLAIVELTKKLAIGLHTMTWFTWKAKFTSTNFTKEDMLKYDEEMKVILPEIVASHILIAALDKNKYEKLTPLVKKMYKLDSQIAQGYNLLEKSIEEGIQLLSNHYDKCQEFNREFETSVSEIISYDDICITEPKLTHK